MSKNANPREIALKILHRTEQDGSFPNLLLSNDLRELENPADRALASNLVYGVLKRKLTLDYIIGKFSKIRTEKLSLWVLNILRLGIFQLVMMDKIPTFAAVNESVKLAKRYANRGSVGYVNGVLRTVSKSEKNVEFPDKTANLVEYLSVYYSHSIWLAEKLLDQFGAEITEEILRANNQPPNLFVREI